MPKKGKVSKHKRIQEKKIKFLMDALNEMNEKDVDELAKVREFNVERAQLVDFMRDLSTAHLKGKNLESEGSNNTKIGVEKSNRIAIRPKSDKSVKGTSPPRVLMPPSSSTSRNNDAGSLLHPLKKFRAPSNTADRFATPLYTSSSSSSNTTNRFGIETTVNRGKLLDFTEEQERERRRAEVALNRPRIADPYQARSHCTIPSTSAHLEQLAQPKRVLDESSNDKFSTYENKGNTFSDTQGISPLSTLPIRLPVELETSCQMTGTNEVTKQANYDKSVNSLGLKESKKNETLAAPFQRSASWNAYLRSPSRKGYLSCSATPGVSKPAKMSSPPPRPRTRHAHSCSPHQKSSTAATFLDSGEAEGNTSVNSSHSAHPNTASRSLGSSASLFHNVTPALKSTSRYSGVSPIGTFQKPFALSSTNLQPNPRIPLQSWTSISSKIEQPAHRKLFQGEARKGPSEKSNPNEGRSQPNGNKKDSSSSNILRKNSCSGVTTLSFSSESNFSNSSSLVTDAKVIKTPACAPSEVQQHNPDGVFSVSSMKSIVINADNADVRRPSAVRPMGSVPFHSLQENASHSDSQISSEYSHSLKCASVVSPNQRMPREHSTSSLVKKTESKSNELKNSLGKRNKGDSSSVSYRDPTGKGLVQNVNSRSSQDIGGDSGKDKKETCQKTMEPSFVTEREREEAKCATAARLVKSQPAPSVAKRDEDDDDFILPDPPMKVVTRRNKCENAQWPPPEFASDENFGFSAGFSSNMNTFSEAFCSPITDVPAESGPAPVVVVKRSTSRKKYVKFTEKNDADDNN